MLEATRRAHSKLKDYHAFADVIVEQIEHLRIDSRLKPHPNHNAVMRVRLAKLAATVQRAAENFFDD
jgi:hypothetical protein